MLVCVTCIFQGKISAYGLGYIVQRSPGMFVRVCEAIERPNLVGDVTCSTGFGPE
jgi:hypothetical protein